jgi:opacity protein-like surface antigen
MSHGRPRLVALALSTAALLFLAARPARAQIYGSISAGANHTTPADVTINVPGAGLGVTYHDVQFSARSLDSPQYYVWRVGRLFGGHARWGLEFEFTHLKVIADTSKRYAATGSIDGAAIPIGASLPMNAEVQEYQMTHGLNFLLVNAVSRIPLGEHSRFALVTRAGIGSTLPHAETNVLGAFRQQYEFAGLGIQGSAGVAIRLTRLISLEADYKLSNAQPKITVAGGTGQTTAVSHQVAIGLAFGFAR